MASDVSWRLLLHRRWFQIRGALSLLPLAAVCVLWVRSYGLSDWVMWMRPSHAGHLRSAPGRIVLYVNRMDWRGAHSNYLWPFEGYGIKHVTLRADHEAGELIGELFSGDFGGSRTIWRRGEYGFVVHTKPNSDVRVIAVAPFWAIALLTASPGLSFLLRRFLRRVRAQRRRKHGLCTACGYDLRATPAGARCPECGFASQPIGAAKERSIMKRMPLVASFGGGFATAILIVVLIIVPIEKQKVRDRLHEDVYSPLKMGMVFTTETLARGDRQRAIEQLDTLVERANLYENFGGPPPKDWYYQLFDRGPATTRVK
jgi:hypothetical protein